MQMDQHNTEHKKIGTIELPAEIFEATVNEALLWEQVKAQRASWRAGTHSTKTRGDVSGGGAKPYKQKGTGRARQGSSRAPNHVGGGVVFGPHPRDYSYRLPKAARRAALRSALSLRVRDKALIVLDKFPIEKPRTKTVEAFVQKCAAKSALIVDVGNDGLRLSARNLQQAKFLEAGALNVYDILNHERLVLTQAALEVVIAKATAHPEPTSSSKVGA